MKVIKLFLFMLVALIAGVLFNNVFAGGCERELGHDLRDSLRMTERA